MRNVTRLLLTLAVAVHASVASGIDVAEIKSELARRYAADQALRSIVITAPELVNRWTCHIAWSVGLASGAGDRANAAWMARVIDEHGWPGRSLVGEQGAHQAWLLVQHADYDVALQRRCLELLRSANEGEVEANQLAYLEDRVCANEGKPQRFGTQLHLVDGVLEPRPIAEPETVDERRAAVGLPPLDEYVRVVREYYQAEQRGGK